MTDTAATPADAEWARQLRIHTDAADRLRTAAPHLAPDADHLVRAIEFWEDAARKNGELYSACENQRDDLKARLRTLQAAVDAVVALADEWAAHGDDEEPLSFVADQIRTAVIEATVVDDEPEVDLIGDAVDTSAWAINLGNDGLEPHPKVIDSGAPGDARVRIHFAFSFDVPDDARVQYVENARRALTGDA